MKNWRYFNLDKFPDKILVGVEPWIISMADCARHMAGFPFYPVSGKRTPEENKLAGGSPTSSHLKGVAIDWRCHEMETAKKMVRHFSAVGFPRIGLNYVQLANGKLAIRGVHTDADFSKPFGLWSKIYRYP